MAPGRDYPYYNGDPVAISPGGWLVILAAVVVAFLQLTLLPFGTPPLNFVPAILMAAIPILALMAVTGWRPPAVFRSFGLREFAIALGFGLLTVVASFIAGYILSLFVPLASNAGVTALAAFGTVDLLLFLARTFFQLIGEELITILPLLAILWYGTQKLGMSRRTALIIAVVVSTLWFAALHLPTYDWNVLQCLLTIGTARVVLTMAYLLTRNIWVSSIAHITNDWSLFVGTYGLGHLPIGTGG